MDRPESYLAICVLASETVSPADQDLDRVVADLHLGVGDGVTFAGSRCMVPANLQVFNESRDFFVRRIGAPYECVIYIKFHSHTSIPILDPLVFII
ncbi:MAG: hypothetical protein WC277_05935, partial [Bacilli bacterium]